MPIFKFKAKKMTGEEIDGFREAKDEYQLARDLKEEGFIIVDFEKEGEKKKGRLSFGSWSFGGPSFSEKMIFTRNLAIMISAGLPLSRALSTLIRQAKNKKFKGVLNNVLENLNKGKNLSESLSEHGKIFSKLYVSMVKAGERSGKLDETLRIVADQMEKDYTLRRKIKGAMIYPAIVVTAMFLIGILMLIYVVPILVSTFQELEIELPLSTKVVIWLSNSLITNSVLLLSSFAGLIFLVVILLRRPAIAKARDFLFLRLPLLSPLVLKINSARVARTLSSMIDSGVEILEALEITTDVVQNVHYKNVLREAKEEIRKGSTISSSFKKAEKVFSPLLGEMIAVGEETGKLPEMLARLAGFYEGEVAEATKDIATVIEPILMVVIGAAVGFFAISMIKPMYSMMGGL